MIEFSLIFLVIGGLVVFGVILAIGIAISQLFRPKQSYPINEQQERRQLANRARRRAEHSRRRSTAPIWIAAGIFLFLGFLLFAFVSLTYVKETRMAHDQAATASPMEISTEAHDSRARGGNRSRRVHEVSRDSSEENVKPVVRVDAVKEYNNKTSRTEAVEAGTVTESHSTTHERADSTKGENEVRAPKSQASEVALTTPVTITMNKDAAIFHLADPYENWKRLDLFITGDGGRVSQTPSSANWVINDNPPPPLVYKSSVASIRSPSILSGNKIVGYSSSWDPNSSESYLEAESSAIHQLAAQYLWELAKLTEEGKKLDSKIFLDIDPIQQCLRIAQKTLKEFEVQRFEQKVEKSIATYYRTAVLYQLPHRHLEDIQSDLLKVARDVKLQQFKEKRNVVWTALAGGVLALVVFLLYLSLNSTTKGYFTWRLRLFSLLLLAGLYFGLFQFREWFF